MQNNMMSLIQLSLVMALSVAISGGAFAQTQEVPAPVVVDPVQALAEKRLEQELNDTSLSDKTAVDFPNRPSLGEMELAPLPGIREIGMTGPASMAPSVSAQDLPSERLLGRITTEVFQEMADLERGNTFLQLQIAKEKFKNDLEEEKSKYRQKRLQEIAEREDVVRSRIQWWQEQEQTQRDIAKREADAEALDREIEESEAHLKQLRQDAQERLALADEGEEVKKIELETKETPVFHEVYTLIGVRGIKGELSAKLKDVKSESVITVKKDDILPSGHVVNAITKDSVTAVYGNISDTIVLTPAQ